MCEYQFSNISHEQHFQTLLCNISDLQVKAVNIGININDKKPSIYQEECDKAHVAENEEEILKVIKETTEIARSAMILISRVVEFVATYSSQQSKYFSSLSSAISYLRNKEDQHKVPKHLLLEWERNMILIDLCIGNKGLYCSKCIAQDMFDICMETFDWLRSLANNNK